MRILYIDVFIMYVRSNTMFLVQCILKSLIWLYYMLMFIVRTKSIQRDFHLLWYGNYKICLL